MTFEILILVAVFLRGEIDPKIVKAADVATGCEIARRVRGMDGKAKVYTVEPAGSIFVSLQMKEATCLDLLPVPEKPKPS